MIVTELLSKPRCAWELKKTYFQRASSNPIFLGVVRLRDDADIRMLNLLKEPTELVLSILVEDSMDIDVEQNEVGLEYYLFGKEDLFSIERSVRNNPSDIFHANMQCHFYFHVSRIFMLPSYAHISGHSSHGL